MKIYDGVLYQVDVLRLAEMFGVVGAVDTVIAAALVEAEEEPVLFQATTWRVYEVLGDDPVSVQVVTFEELTVHLVTPTVVWT